MSAIPPNLVGPILQSPFVAGQTAAARDIDEAGRVSAERKGTSAITESDSTVETTDNDTQVYSDAEGSGSQGRTFSQKDDEPEITETGTAAPLDEHVLDIEA